MGIYDRDYYRQQGGFSLRAPQTVVGRLVLINAIIWLADAFLDHQLGHLLALWADVFAKPWLWWEFISYGFAHSVRPEHIILNMLMLWMFGAEVESAYGPREFLRIYLVMIAVGGLAWAATARLTGGAVNVPLVGASAGVVGVTMLFVLNNPHRTILFMFVLPLPAWILGVFMVAYDIFGAMKQGDNVAYVAHLAGAAFALLYFRFRWNLGRGLGPGRLLAGLRRRPRLRVHVPGEEAESEPAESDLSQQVDQILEKIHNQGETSLTRKERRILEAASRQYQKRRQNGK